MLGQSMSDSLNSLHQHHFLLPLSQQRRCITYLCFLFIQMVSHFHHLNPNKNLPPSFPPPSPPPGKQVTFGDLRRRRISQAAEGRLNLRLTASPTQWRPGEASGASPTPSFPSIHLPLFPKVLFKNQHEGNQSPCLAPQDDGSTQWPPGRACGAISFHDCDCCSEVICLNCTVVIINTVNASINQSSNI